MVHAKKSRDEMQHNMEAMEERVAVLEEQNVALIQENKSLKDENMKIARFAKGLEWDIENICEYLKKQQDK